MTTPQKIGRYEILEELGRGAMGAVYRAKDPAMDRIVALKTIIATALASEQGSEFRERFFREARAAGNLAHPGIVPVFDVGEHEGSPFLVMEYVSGWTLASAAARGERMDLNRMCEIGQKIAEALGYAHQRGVIHRDIKPANILITSRESYGVERPKITDFGIAKLTESEATMTGKMLGTPAFMPPEQFTGAPVDGRSDIFSLGVVLYWLATAEQPFPGEGLTAVLYKVVHTEPIPPRKLNPSLPPRFESIILKCMEKDPAARYQTAEELAQELAEVRAGKPSPVPGAASGRVFTPIHDADATLIEPIRGMPEATTAVATAGPGTVGPATPASAAAAPTAPVAHSARATGLGPLPGAASARKTLFAGIGAAAIVILGCGLWFVSHSKKKTTTAPAAVAAPFVSQQNVASGASTPVPASTSSAALPSSAPAPATAPSSTGTEKQAVTTAAKPKPSAATPAKSAPAASSGVRPTSSPVIAAEATPSTAPAAAQPKNAGASIAAFAKNAAAKISNAFQPKAAAGDASIAAGLGFDPSKLDPKENARLTLDSSDMPAGVQFIVEMNGKVYSRGTHGPDVELYVPPGTQKFSVNANSKSIYKDSNTVSTNFKAGKHYTLRVELHVQDQPASAGMPQALYSDSQIVVGLK